MAQVPAAVASTATASIGAQVGSFVVNLGANYLLGRLAAQDGPRLGNLSAAGGEYGVAMPKLFGEKVRCTGIFIAQADIKETRHTVEDYSEIVGALTGAVQGFMVGGPVGAVVGAVIGGLLGAATPDQHYYTYSDTFAAW
jgi:phage tail tape-measure protein